MYRSVFRRPGPARFALRAGGASDPDRARGHPPHRRRVRPVLLAGQAAGSPTASRSTTRSSTRRRAICGPCRGRAAHRCSSPRPPKPANGIPRYSPDGQWILFLSDAGVKKAAGTAKDAKGQGGRGTRTPSSGRCRPKAARRGGSPPSRAASAIIRCRRTASARWCWRKSAATSAARPRPIRRFEIDRFYFKQDGARLSRRPQPAIVRGRSCHRQGDATHPRRARPLASGLVARRQADRLCRQGSGR